MKMESKAESFSVSVVDVLGILVPGLTWLLLLATAAGMAADAKVAITPVVTWSKFTAAVTAGTWAAVTLLAIASVIGYAAKGRATYFASILSAPFLRLQSRFSSLEKRDRYFPYVALHSTTPYHVVVVELLSRVTGVSVDTLPGNQPFTAAKRYLRIASPALWNDLERLEAEVRLLAGMLVAALFSAALAVMELLRDMFALRVSTVQPLIWLFLSTVAYFFLADSFCRTRIREVDYAYLYTLLSAGFQTPNSKSPQQQ